MYPKLLIIIRNNQFWVQDINFRVFSLKRMPKKQISRSGICHHQQQKCYRNPFFCHFKPPKEYGRHCHRYLGKVKFFWGNLDHKQVPKMRLLFRAGFKSPPPSCRVKPKYFLLNIYMQSAQHLCRSCATPTLKLCNFQVKTSKNYFNYTENNSLQ